MISSLNRKVRRMFRRIGEMWSDQLDSIAELRGKRRGKAGRVFGRIGDLWSVPFHSAAELRPKLMRWVRRLFNNRRWVDAGAGLPALLMLAFLSAVVAYPYTRGPKEKVGDLEVAANAHLAAGRYSQARMAALRLGLNDGWGQKAAFMQMQALRGLKRDAEAVRLLRRLAPDVGMGYAPAHVLRAVSLFSSQPPEPEAAQEHLKRSLTLEPRNQQALELAVRVAAAQKDWRMAMAHLENLKVDERHDLLLLQATVLQSAGLEKEAVAAARKAEDTCRFYLGKVDDSIRARLQVAVAAALALQRKYDAAVEWLVSVSGKKPIPEAVQMLGGLFLDWSRYARKQDLPDKTLPLVLLEKGLQVTPQNPEMLMAFLAECDASLKDEAEKRSHVQRYLTGGGINTSFMHYFLGMQEWKAGNKEGARNHWDMASMLNPNFSLITNNLAMAVASVSTDKAELEKALSMMDPLVTKDPRNPYFLDTRSLVFSKLGRMEDAVKDMLAALETASDKSATHAKLAGLYDKMGMADLARLHTEKAAAEKAAADKAASK